MVTHLMGADLNNIVKTQKLSDDHVQFLVYQILRGLKVPTSTLGVIVESVCACFTASVAAFVKFWSHKIIQKIYQNF